MTGFARETTQGGWGELAWELRSVNHRYLDVTLRLPEDLRVIESEVRATIAERLGRGKLEAGLRLRTDTGGAESLEVDTARLDRLAAACREAGDALRRAGGQDGEVDPVKLLAWPGVLRQRELDIELLRTEALALLRKALESLADARGREGARLAGILQDRLTSLAGHVAEVRKRLPQVREEMRNKLLTRLQEITTRVTETDPARLEQELVMLAQRQDVDEELSRLDSHVEEVRQTLKRSEAVGRRLDFLMQEFNREANTLGSKSQDTDITRHAVEMKVIIEQMREQVQNIE
jgi:uncharacterized protein (TIGR00255 family)